jgi:hypothetical protein
MKLKLPPGTKIKDAPLAHRLLLRLVTLNAQGKETVDLITLAEEEHAILADGVAAIKLLEAEKHITIEPVKSSSLPVFKIVVVPEVMQAMRSEARGYRCCRVAQAEKTARAATNGTNQISCAGLAPIPLADREGQMKAAVKLAKKLTAADMRHNTWALAGCIVRLGLEPVSALVEEVCGSEHPQERNVRRLFFEAYRAKRDAAVVDASVEKTK